MKYVVFTDMDGTLIDHHTYSYDAALPALELLQRKNVPLIICTSKTRAEIEKFREDLKVLDPFISENGGAIFVPKTYFKVPFHSDQETEDYLVIKQGTSYDTLRNVLKDIKKTTECQIKGFGDMTTQEISADSGLDLESAKLSKMREYDEPFVIGGDESCIQSILKEIQNRGLSYTQGGRYFHIIGDNDKGKAVSILTDIFKLEYGNLTTIGLGDSLNDLPMLASVDVPVLVQKPNGTYESLIEMEVKHAEGIGPTGWNRAIMEILE
ncbi:MAG: mannosyl-3-phosphoglycerate phosphatase [Methanotrichaceae archaeon]